MALDNQHAGIAALVGQGSAPAADGDRGMFAQRNGGDHIRTYIIRRVPLDWIAAAGLSPHDTGGIRDHLLEEYAAWGPAMQQMITDNDGPFVNRPIMALPVPHTWQHNPTVTLLGDAAHLAPPLGVGVNLALLDACELALALAKAPTVDKAISAYEATMLPRSADWQKRLENGAEGLLSADMFDGDEDEVLKG
ncbi:FAD-dependent oxidoreductase [Krasilnikovia sp. MM14-A1004]|uniref:FAD-dependent oxidoreductase n=1 Tax=Krasilnikovia sp. MM14-A1004 TaxID=3373541 RepID=UPI00399C646B